MFRYFCTLLQNSPKVTFLLPLMISQNAASGGTWTIEKWEEREPPPPYGQANLQHISPVFSIFEILEMANGCGTNGCGLNEKNAI